MDCYNSQQTPRRLLYTQDVKPTVELHVGVSNAENIDIINHTNNSMFKQARDECQPLIVYMIKSFSYCLSLKSNVNTICKYATVRAFL